MGRILSDCQSPHELSESDFGFLCSLVRRETGIVLGQKKREMVYRRLMRRTRELKLASFQSYIALLKGQNSQELPEFINSMTTNLTSFYREQHHFEFLRDRFVPEHRRLFSQSKRMRIWSAGCSTGEEPYCIGMTLLAAESWGDWDLKILATDLDSAVLNTAQQGIYNADKLERVGHHQLATFFLRGAGSTEGKVRVKPNLQQHIYFKQLNLLNSRWPIKGPFDVIFCRNVLIYFDKDTQAQIVTRFVSLLRPGGYLMLGHSESLGKHIQGLEMIGRTIFKRSRVMGCPDDQF